MTLGLLIRNPDGSVDLHADTLLYQESFSYQVNKILQVGDSFYVLSGDQSACGRFTKAVAEDYSSPWTAVIEVFDADFEGDFEAIYYDSKSKQAAYLTPGCLEKTDETILAVGIGAAAAVACLRLGADAATVYEIVSDLLPQVGRKYTTVRLHAGAEK